MLLQYFWIKWVHRKKYENKYRNHLPILTKIKVHTSENGDILYLFNESEKLFRLASTSFNKRFASLLILVEVIGKPIRFTKIVIFQKYSRQNYSFLWLKKWEFF